MRKSRVFSAMRGFIDVPKVFQIQFCVTTECPAKALWNVVKRVKKFISSIAWLCKMANDAGCCPASFYGWTGYTSAIQVPFDCISLGVRIIKVCKVYVAWNSLQQKSGNMNKSEYAAACEKLHQKGVKKVLFATSKALDVSSHIIDAMASSVFALIVLNALAQVAIKTTILFYENSHAPKTLK